MSASTKWRKSVSAYSDRCMDLPFLKMLRNCGFDGIDLNFSRSFFEDAHEEKLETISSNLHETGLLCAQIHLPTYGLFVDSGKDDPETERRIEMAIRVAAVLNAPWAACHVRSAVDNGFDRIRAMEDNIRWLKRLCGIAVQHGVGIAVENLPTFPDRPDAPFFSSNMEDHCALIDAVDHPLVGACWDFGHANLNLQHRDKTQKELLLMLGERLKIVHVHNNYKTRDSHLPLSIGCVDWHDAISGLREIGFSGFFSLESGCGSGGAKLEQAYCEYCAKATDIILEQI